MLFFYIGFSLAIAAEVYAILERISDFYPSSDSIALRYLLDLVKSISMQPWAPTLYIDTII